MGANSRLGAYSDKYGISDRNDLMKTTLQLLCYDSAQADHIDYYTLFSLPVFSLAKSLQLILEINATYRSASYLLADQTD